MTHQAVRPSRPRSAKRVNRLLPGLEPLEGRRLLSGQPTSLSDVSGSGIRTGTATLSADLSSGGSPLAGETVEFTLNESGTVTSVGMATTDANGVATLTGVSLADFNVGTFAGFVGASFAGDSSYTGSNAGGTLTVTPQAVDQVALGSSANPSLPGELMTFGVMVIPLSAGPTPTGTIQFQIDGTNLGSAVTLTNGAAASGLVTSLGVGTHTVTAIYSGDATYPSSTATLTQTVENPSQVKGQIYTVTSLGDTGTGSGTSGDLRYAITQADANPGSVIDFSVTGTIQLTKALPDVSANTAINGPGPSLLTLKGGGASSNFSVLDVNTGSVATISGLTVTGGNNKFDGGGVYNSGTLTLADSVITGNSARQSGGGVENYNGYHGQPFALTLTDCAVTGNSADTAYSEVGGGVVVSRGCTLTVNESVISGNTGPEGGGVVVGAGAVLNAYDSSISQNTATGGAGGGISSGGTVT